MRDLDAFLSSTLFTPTTAHTYAHGAARVDKMTIAHVYYADAVMQEAKDIEK